MEKTFLIDLEKAPLFKVLIPESVDGIRYERLDESMYLIHIETETFECMEQLLTKFHELEGLMSEMSPQQIENFFIKFNSSL
jgi:hypothetical protein